MEAPLVSFVLVAYNQEQYVGQAVSSALAQTYEPLEVILSDDCSSDRTFEIMEQMVAAYKGPHQIVLNRNSRNLGIVRHVNKVWSLCHGELIIGAAGDDISVPERTSTVVDAWNEGGRGPAVIYAQVRKMSKDGTLLDTSAPVVSQLDTRAHVLLREWGGHITGASCAITMSVVRIFGEIRSDMPCEDVPLTWRSALCGRLLFLPQALVFWRVGAGGVWSSAGYTRTPQERMRLLVRWVRERHRLSFQACQDVAGFPAAGRRERVAARRFNIESRCALEGLEAGIVGFCWACVRSFLLVGWPSHMMQRIIHMQLRYWFEDKRTSESAGWRCFFRCYYFLRRHGMPNP